MKPASIKLKARKAIERGRLDEARPLWSQLCELEPLEVDNWLILAAIDEQLGFLPAALGHLNYAFQLDPADVDLWVKSGQIKWSMRNFEGALADLGTALCQDFTDLEHRRLLAGWLRQLRRYAPAVAHYRYLVCHEEDAQERLPDLLGCVLLSGGAALEQVSSLGTEARNIALADECVAAVAARLAEWLPPSAWPHLEDTLELDEPERAYQQRILAVLESYRPMFVWSAYFERIAQVEAELPQPNLQTLNESILSLLRPRLQAANGDPVHIVEVGCGSGLLGRVLRRQHRLVNLTGVDFSDRVLWVANGGNDYDTLLHWVRLSLHDSDWLAGVSCLLLQPRVAAYETRMLLLAKFLQMVQRPDLLVVFDASMDDRSAIEALLEREGQLFAWKAEKQLLWIEGTKAKPLPSGCCPEKDRLENAGNELIAAVGHMKQGRFEACARSTRTILEAYPLASQALFNKGLLAQQLGDLRHALRCYRRARIRYRGFADNWFQLAVVHQQLGHQAAMHACYRRCLTVAPNHRAALQNLVAVHYQAGNIDTAWHYLRALLGQNSLDEGIKNQVRETVIESGHPVLKERYETYLQDADWIRQQFGAALQSRYFDRAEKLLKRLVQLDPGEQTEFFACQLAEKSGRIAAAQAAMQALIGRYPEKAMYRYGLASLLADQGRIPEAYDAWLQALEITPIEDQNRQNFLFYTNYCQFVADEVISRYHLDWGKEISDRTALPAVVPGCARSGGKIRVGYVSPDFRMHSVAMFLYNVLKYHDRSQFEVFCYATTPVEDPMTVKLRLFADCWRTVTHLDDAALADRVRADKIDILVDLAGHTAGNRLPVFALRPAPVQVTYLGYPNTTGMREMDFRFTDAQADPPGETEHLHSERLVRLPSGFLSYSRHLASTPVTLFERPHESRRYTFACCNNIYKVNEEVVRVFASILQRMPEASLLLKAHNLNNPEIIAHYRALFKYHGVDEAQLHLMNTIDVGEHQNLYNSIDIALDPFPYNGTTTTCDALWMGVPVLTLAGSRHAGRVGVSLLSQVGLEDWIAKDEAEYIEKAVVFARDTSQLESLKRGMRSRLLGSPLMRPGEVTREIENAYTEMAGRP